MKIGRIGELGEKSEEEEEEEEAGLNRGCRSHQPSHLTFLPA